MSWLLASYVYDFWGNVLGVFSWTIQRLWGVAIRPVIGKSRKWTSSSSHTDTDDEEHLLKDLGPSPSPTAKDSIVTVGNVAPPSKLYCTLVLVATVTLIILRAVRPHEYAYSFLSWVLPLSPFVGGAQCFTSVEVAGLLGNGGWLKGKSALSVPPHWDFLPPESMPGFEDWYSCHGNCRRKLHYTPEKDPLHIDNLGDPILDPMREAFDREKVSIKHVVFIKLESTRSDVFPVREGTHMFDTVQESYDHDVPKEVQQRFAKLTSTAEWLTGLSGPFSNNTAPPRGGIVATDAFTTGTYTLKSLPGSLCGITPLVADFNREYNHHIYQPCLPHIFNMLNTIIANETKEPQGDDYLTWPWESRYMQSVTATYDNQDLLTPQMGFHDWITKETLEDPKKWKHPPTTEPVCQYGYPDEELRDHIHDAIEDAETNHKRLFLAHLTGTTHEPWTLPEPWDYDRELVGHSDGGALRNVKRYLNAIGYDDRWMKTIFDMLEETGIANQTLVILAGDHGVSVPEGAITPYDDPQVGAFHVPFVFSHPHLPPVTIDAPVSLQQALPTILDLLISSKSLPPSAVSAASQILSLYEGQSLLRPIRNQTDDGHADWQFQVMNTGGTWLSMRSTTRPYRLVVPLRQDVEWRFTDLESDPDEKHAIWQFDGKEFEQAVREKHGADAESWVGDAAQVAKWWVKDNWRRWQYDPCQKN